MRVFYDEAEKSWFHSNKEKTITIGSNEMPLEYKELTAVKESTLSIPLLCNNLNAGPIIGIMTSRKEELPITGNFRLFKDLQKTAVTNGGVTVVFTPDCIRSNSLKGYLFSPEENRWIQVISPLPHVVYNRVPFRKTEQTNDFQSARLFFQTRGIPFFNPCFIDKYEMYLLLSKNEKLKPFLPETILVDQQELKTFLYKKRKLYLKPVKSSRGKGISKIRLLDNNSVKYIDKTDQVLYKDFNDFWDNRKQLFYTKKYIAQEEITPDILNGERYDFRILAHLQQKQYRITGVGVRASNPNLLTTHVPNGGFILPYSRFQSKQHDAFIEKIANICGELLSRESGTFGEFSIDAGVTDKGKYVIYEINSKPMSFDEHEIESERAEALYKLFIELTNY